MGFCDFLKSKEEVEAEQQEAETSRERVYREARDRAEAAKAALRQSALANHHWEGVRLVHTPTSEVVTKIEETDFAAGTLDYFGDWRAVYEWQTTDGKKYVTLEAAKRHQEELQRAAT